MTDRPILFSAPMIRALLDGRKTQTRRILGVDRVYEDISSEAAEDFELRGWETFYRGDALCAAKVQHYAVGDRLWVREAWRPTYGAEGWREYLGRVARPSDFDPATTAIEYLADGERELAGKNRPGIHMPRWASRLTLIVTDVRVQRLAEISEEDAIAEGIEWRDGCWGTYNADGTMRCGGSPYPVEAYRCLWININGAGAWEANPWVCAISFHVHKANIDALANAEPAP